MNLRRVVVTGIGALTPIGNTKDEYWEGLVSGRSGAAPITYFDTEKFKTKFACELKNFVATDFLDRKEARKMDRFAQYAMVASDEAIKDAKLRTFITQDSNRDDLVAHVYDISYGSVDKEDNLVIISRSA